MRARFIAVACAVGVALAAIVRDERTATPTHPATAARPPPAPAPTFPRLDVSARDRDAIYDYFGVDHAAGGCPPGLTKESNGCLPAGGGRGGWAIGRPLASDVIIYPLPAVLLGQLTPPPNGYRYGRVGNDVLIIESESRMVVAAVAGIGRN